MQPTNNFTLQMTTSIKTWTMVFIIIHAVPCLRQNALSANHPGGVPTSEPIGGFDLYPRSRTDELNMELFRNPTAEYRGAPFWSWNNKLNLPQLLRQIDYLKEMGFGGGHIHPRTGLDTEYMGAEYLEIIKACIAKAKQENMLMWLYDEDRWPSGFGGGLVTKDPSHRAKMILFTTTPPGEGGSEAETLFARYEVRLKNGCLDGYRRLDEGQDNSPGTGLWYACLETEKPTSWYNGQTYVDVLSKEAIERFIEVTHDRYFKAFGEEFGKSVPAIFTDEPHVVRKGRFSHPDEIRDIRIPFTADLFETYERVYGQRLQDSLPELFWDLADGKVSVVRYRYHDHLAERFVCAYSDTLGQWCRAHQIALTGHLLMEGNLDGQTAVTGDVMRHYRSFQIPGIDLLLDRREYVTAKQAQSAAHQYGRSAVVSELYGITGWHYDFVGHKAQGDWQAALGVTIRVPHLAWVSMAGEAKRDYPASIFYQSPWYREYHLIEDYFSRIHTVLTRGKPAVRVAVIHPIESYWLCYGPKEQTQEQGDRLEQRFQDITRWLLFGLIDFDFICESLLPSQCLQQKGTVLEVGRMAYDAVIVPDLRTIRSTTLDRLEPFASAGGKVIFAGQVPSLVDAQPSDRALKLSRRCINVDYNGSQILRQVEPYRQIDVRRADGQRADSLLYQMRIDGKKRHVFLCHTDRENPCGNVLIQVPGDWSVCLLDPMEGTSRPLASQRKDPFTIIPWSFPAHGSLLLTLNEGWQPMEKPQDPKEWQDRMLLGGSVPVTFSERNVLLLDQAQWRLNDEPWRESEEILRIENLARARLGLGKKTGHIAQPWTDRSPAAELGKLSLKFMIDCEIEVREPMLAMEQPENAYLEIDSNEVMTADKGYFVDEAIRTIQLPTLVPGKHEMILVIPYTRKTNVEWCYLLGDFGVEVNGRNSKIIAPVRFLKIGDWAKQGLPFYAGNVTYHFTLPGENQPVRLVADQFKSPLLSIALDGNPAGKIAFAPYCLELGELSDGEHKLDITVYGNRANAFGPVHNAKKDLVRFDPSAWRSTGEDWTYEYRLKPMGILAEPRVQRLKRN